MSTRVSVDLLRYERAIGRRNDASRELYDAEVALHASHQSQVDEWVHAANEHLHMALLVLGVAETELAAATRVWENGGDAELDDLSTSRTGRPYRPE